VKVPRSQDLSGGPDSTNLQAGRDIVYGVTAAEARQIALDVYNANFLKLAGVAEDVARDRAERITRDYLGKLQAENPAGLGSVQDPDMLQAIYTAQKAYAVSGEEDLERTLVDLLVDRSGQQDRELKTLVLNEAIAALPKLSVRQRKSIAVCFFLKYTRYTGPLDLDGYYNSLTQGLAHFVGMLSDKRADYQHIQSAGVGSISVLTWQLSAVFTGSATGFFTTGFTEDQMDEDLRKFLSDPDVFVPCIRDPQKWQVNVTAQQDAGALATAKGIAPGRLENLAGLGWMTAPAIQADLISRVPEMRTVFDCWDSPISPLKNLELTSVGIAIGHAYWRQASGHSAPLDIWL
jgi:hypothetical protein